MERIEELEKCIQEYRIKRVEAKIEYLSQNKEKMELALKDVLEKLVLNQITKQLEEKRLVSALFICHLMSSYYTGSYEMMLGLSSSKLYLDNHSSYIYWTPPHLYNNVNADMEEVKKNLQKRFTRLEEYELFRIKLKLLHDDWELFEKIFPELVQNNSGIMKKSSLYTEEELLILSGGYMDQLRVIGHISN